MKEDQRTEFKRNWRDEFLKELCAFANSQGGTLYIGMEDDGTVVGISDAKALLENMPNKVLSNLGILANVELMALDGKEYVSVRVEGQDNPGPLPEELTVASLMEKHASMPRNPKIAKVFFLAGFIESWGRGYERIRESFDKAHLAMPKFGQVHGGFMATIQREVFMRVQGGKGETETVIGNDFLKGFLKDFLKERGAKLTERQENIVYAICGDFLITNAELAKLLGTSDRTIRTETGVLRESGILVRINGKKEGHWEFVGLSGEALRLMNERIAAQLEERKGKKGK